MRAARTKTRMEQRSSVQRFIGGALVFLAVSCAAPGSSCAQEDIRAVFAKRSHRK